MNTKSEIRLKLTEKGNLTAKITGNLEDFRYMTNILIENSNKFETKRLIAILSTIIKSYKKETGIEK